MNKFYELLKSTIEEEEDIKVSVLAGNKYTPEDLLELIYEKYKYSGQDKILIKIASNPNTPIRVLKKLLEINLSDNHILKFDVASNPNTPEHILDKIVKTEYTNDYLITLIASNPKASGDTLSYIYKNMLKIIFSQDNAVRGLEEFENDLKKRLSSNPNTPPSILEELAKSGEEKVRSNVASNPSTPPNILEELSKNNFSSIQSGVASNPNTPSHILNQMAQIDVVSIQETIALNPSTQIKTLKELLYIDNFFLKKAIASNPNTPPNMLEELSTDENEEVRLKVASNPNTPFETLLELSNKVFDNIPNLKKLSDIPNLFKIEEKDQLEISINAFKTLIKKTYDKNLQDAIDKDINKSITIPDIKNVNIVGMVF